MSDVLLIFPHPGSEEEQKQRVGGAAPMGILSIGSVLVESRFSVQIIDVNVNEEYEKEIIKGLDGCLFCGISVNSFQVWSAIQIASFIRQHSEVPIVFGGIHPTLLPEQTCSDELVDIVVVGEGEYTCLELAQAFKSQRPLSTVKGIFYKENGQILSTPKREIHDLNKLPFLNYELIDVNSYLRRGVNIIDNKDEGVTRIYKRSLGIHAGMGCPHRCTMCSNPTVYQRKWRGKSAERILDEIGFLIEKYNIEHVDFRDDNFFTSKKRIFALLEGIQQRGYKFIWWAFIRADYFNEGYLSDEVVGELRRAGCVGLDIGVESGSSRVLKRLKKDVTVEQVENAARLCSKHNICLEYGFMMGVPYEQKTDVIQTVKLIEHIRRVDPNAVIAGPECFRPYPGTELSREAVELGVPIPQTLRGWANASSGLRVEDGFISLKDLPWVKDRGFLELVFFYVDFVLDPIRNRKRSSRGRFFIIFMKSIYRIRVLLRFWKLPFEPGFIRSVLSWRRKRG